MATKKFLDTTGLTSFLTQLKTLFVAQEPGKTLSTNDFDASAKSKLDSLKNYTLPAAKVDTLGGVKVGTGLTVTEEGLLSAEKAKWAEVEGKPTNVSDFTNDEGYQTASDVESTLTEKGYKDEAGVNAMLTSGQYQTKTQMDAAILAAKGEIEAKGYQTSSDVSSAIASAISSADHLKRKVVEAEQLPEVGEADANTIYMLKIKGADEEGQNRYTEWMVLDGKWEKTGDSDVDLKDYVKTTDIEAITAEEITALFSPEP